MTLLRDCKWSLLRCIKQLIKLCLNLHQICENPDQCLSVLYLWAAIMNAVHDLLHHFASGLQGSCDDREVDACHIKWRPFFLLPWRQRHLGNLVAGNLHKEKRVERQGCFQCISSYVWAM